MSALFSAINSHISGNYFWKVHREEVRQLVSFDELFAFFIFDSEQKLRLLFETIFNTNHKRTHNKELKKW